MPVCTCVFICVCACVCICTRYRSTLGGLFLAWSLMVVLNRLPNKGQGLPRDPLVSPFPCICHHAWPWRQFLWTDIRSSCLHDKHFSDWVIPPVPCSHFQSFYIIYSFLIILSVLVLPKPYSESRPKLKHPLSFTCQICISFPFLTGAVFQAESSWGMLTTSRDEAPALG